MAQSSHFSVLHCLSPSVVCFSLYLSLSSTLCILLSLITVFQWHFTSLFGLRGFKELLLKANYFHLVKYSTTPDSQTHFHTTQLPFNVTLSYRPVHTFIDTKTNTHTHTDTPTHTLIQHLNIITQLTSMKRLQLFSQLQGKLFPPKQSPHSLNWHEHVT